MKNTRTELSQRVQYALLAGMAGAFLIPQVGFAAPTGGHSATANINEAENGIGNTEITSKKTNNVITWRDYSVASGEHVRYDGGDKTNNYLNIVTGANTSNIDGKIEGGNHVYIVNPNGVIFGKSAVVNVGHLHVSTQAVSTVNKTADMENNVSPLDTSAGLSDVVNMGKITATSVEVHGKNIRFLNAADVKKDNTTRSAVVLHTDTANGGYAHIGYRGTVPTNYKVNPTTGNPAGVSPEYYQLVKDKTELDKINDDTASLAGNYMLENDIDLGGAAHTPLGGNDHGAFTGKFDGNFFQIKNINVSGVNDAGLFGVLSGARIDNLGIVGGTVTGSSYAGGIAAQSKNKAALYNVYVKETIVKGPSYSHAGILGCSDDTTIDGAYSTAVVGTDGAGIVGTTMGAETTIKNAYSDAVYEDKKKALFLASVDPGTAEIRNVYTTGTTISSNDNAIKAKFYHVYATSAFDSTKVQRLSLWQKDGLTSNSPTDKLAPNEIATYHGFTINNDGAPGAKWRIYEGRTLPLLTAFMNGRVDSLGSVGVEYKYRKFNQADGSAVNDPANAVKSNNRADITNLTYDSKIIRIMDSAGNVITTSKNINYDKNLTDAQKNTVQMYTDTGTPLSKTDNIRNAGTKAILWSDQDGPNLRNVNVTIGKRKIDVKGGAFSVEREYNGSADVTEEFKKKFKAGGISANGFIDGDSVTLDYTNFKATMQAEGTIRAKDANDNYGDPLKKVKFEGQITVSGDDADNYDTSGLDFGAGFVGTNGLAKITKAKLTLKVVKDSATKIYDGTDTVTQSDMDAATNLKLKNDDIKTDADTGHKDEVSLDTGAISGSTYIKSDGTPEIHAGNNHKIRYKNVVLTGADSRNYKLVPSSTTATLTGTNLDLQGTITRRRITTDDFKVYEKGRNAAVEATKTYDGNREYTPDSTKYYLSSNQASNTEDTGVVTRDRGYITFALTRKANFNTKDVRTADKITYNVSAQADKNHTDDVYHENHLLSDYWVLNNADNPLTETTAFDATGKGKITPRVLTATVVNNRIEKVYDGTKKHTETGETILRLGNFVGGEEKRNTSTVTYTNENVVSDTVGSQEKEQDVNYTASFERATGDESDNYTLDPTGKTVISSVTPTGSYKGVINRRALTLEMGAVQKVYDGTAANKKSGITAIRNVAERDKATVTAETLKNKHRDMLTAGTAKSSYGRGKDSSFDEDANASNGNTHNVRYENMDKVFGTAFDALKNNYTMDSTVYGAGEITRRRIDPSGFKVRKSDGTLADATKVYDGTDTYNLPSGAYLTGSTASGDTGIVSHDFGKVVFELKTNSPGHFTKDAAGANRTSHKSEANYIAYDVKAKTLDPTNNPLSNYTFGVAGSPRELERVTDTNPAQVTARGSITPASLHAATQEISKVYDGLTAHTDGNRNPVKGDTVVSFTGWVSGQTRDNTSTALYADRNVSRDSSGNVIKKNVDYTAQLTGQYADDYQIVNDGGTVISTATGTGDAKTVTANLGTVTDAGKITPRKLNIKMGDVSKTYDGTAGNTSATVTGFTDDPASSVLADVLGVDNVTATRLTNRYQGMVSPANTTTTSTYGRVNTDATFGENVNASNGTPHDVQYTNMRNAFKDEFGSTTAGNYAVDETVYGKGTINRREITPNNFQVKDANGNVANATKVYDGTTTYTLENGWHLTPAAGPGTGVIPADYGKVVFRLNGDAQFADSSYNPTANVASATKVLYNVKAEGDAEKIKNYTLNGVNLESGSGKVSGDGEITRRVLELDLVQNSGIDKVYDGTTTLKNTETKNWNALRDSDSTGNVRYATGSTVKDKLVTTDGTSFNITSNYMEGAAADKNVKRSGGNIVDKDILYNISITGGDARNYSFRKGAAVTDAEAGLTLSATGKITPKDLSGAFNEVTKTYDGTKYVDPSKVGFKTGADGVLSGDTIELATHTESFQSENVNGDGTTEIIDGTARKNWINYENLSLGGADAGNYMLKSTKAKGLGTIKPFELNDGSITFTKRQAEKVYDGTKDVKYGDLTGDALKKRHITSAKVTVGTAPPVDILDDLKLEEAQYDKKDVDGGRKTGRVTYTLSYDRTKNPNFSLKTGVTSFTTKGDGIITKKDVTATVKSPLTKTYDAGKDVVGVAKNNANQVVANASDNITLDGLVANDGTTYTTTAAYADKNAGDNKRIDYTLNFTANGGNYNLKYNGADNAGAFSTNNNTITKRNVDVNFDHVSKDYDSKETNTKIAPKVSAADAAVLQQDSAGNVSGTNITNLTGVTSAYGTLSGGTFTPDANAGDKTVRYHGVGTAMGTVFGTNNYDFNVKDGTGRINRAKINAGNVVFDADDAHKTYDGTTTVKYGGSSANSEVRKYINRIGVTLNGNWINLQNDVTMDSAEYSEANATNGTKHRVTYKFHLNNSNIDISGDNTFSKDKEGIIDRRVLNLDLAQKSGIDKIYDATDKVHNTDELHYDAFADHDAKGNVTYAAGTTDDTKLVRKDGNPETTVKVTTAYADENAGAKNVNYTARIEGDAGKNYTLKYGATEGDAETGINFVATGTIAKRKLTLGFKNVEKQYDTTTKNNDMTITSARGGNSDGRGDDTLKKDGILAADGTVNTGAFDMTNVKSFYGTGNSNATFAQNADVVTDANGNVVENGKDVQYKNLAGTLAGQSYAGNYEIVNTAYGKGTIRKRVVTANDFKFNINNATKTYDGTKDVYWKDTVTGKSYKDMDHVKNYFSTSKLDLGGGNLVDINLNDIQLNSAQYNHKNAVRPNGITYNVTINTKNFEFSGTRTRDIDHTGDTITKRDLATMLPKHLIKEYDGKQTFDETNRDYVNALANENITHIVKADQGKIQLKVKGEYDDPNASAETKVDAQKGIHLPTAPNGRKVKYTLTLSGDADTLANYTIDGHDTTHTVTGKPADIYKKTLTVEVERKVKDYDGTVAVNNLAKNDVTFQGMANNEALQLDDDSIKKVKGQYLDSAGKPDENVRRDANRNVLDKAVEYTGLNDALNDLATRNNTAKNYRVEGGSRRYTADDGKGRIDPLKLHDPSNDVKMTFAATGPSKIYDRETTVKYKGLGTDKALKNYLTDATVMVGGKARSIKDELEIDPTRTHYDNKNAGTGKTVTYGFTYTGNNFEIADFTKESDVKGEIKRKDVKVLPVDQLWKTYDSERDVYVEGDDSIFTRRGGKQGKRVTTGDSVLELEPSGIISGDVVQNDSWAEFEDENAGTGKKVKYHTSFSGTDAANYRFVDVSGGEITKPLETDNNTIAKRKLNIGFDGLPNVTKAYDTDAKNDKVTARITDDPNGSARKVLQRDKVHVFGDRLTQLNNTNIRSDYGEGKTDRTFRSDPNAGHKDVQYRGVGKALRNILGGSADNYETVPDNAYSDGAITKADVSRNEFDPNFTHAHKEYDGTSNVQNLDKRYDKEHSFWNSHKLDPSNIESLTGSYRGTPSKRGKDVGTNKIVDYTLKLSNRNFNFVGWDGVIQKEGTGDITPREIFEESRSPLTKVYDGTRNIANVGDDLLTFRHKSGERPFIKNDDVRNSSTATYDNKNVKWKKDAWKQGEGTVEDVGVTYRLKLTGRDAENYKIVSAPGRTVKDGVDQDGTRIQTTDGTGRITPKDIHLKADSQTRWINEGLPDSYSGTPMGSNLGRKDVPELVPGEVLPGQIEYSSPNARLRWGDYAINGTYRAPNAGTRYQLPDGTWTTQSFAGGDGDAVSRNYRFVQDPANATAFHMGPYVPDNQYYKALTQTSKMLPDEYAYEHAALDYRSHFGRDAETEIATAPPSINVIYDGTDVTRAGIHVTDDTVYTIVNEVFGA